MHHSLIAAGLLLLTTAVTSVPVPYTLCQNSPHQLTNQIVKIESVDANVWPPVAGELFTVKASGMLSEPLTSATYHITVKFDEMTVMDKKGSVAEFIKLPLNANELITVEKSEKIPAQAPDGDVQVNALVFDDKNNMILCVDVVASLGPPPEITYIPDMSMGGVAEHHQQYSDPLPLAPRHSLTFDDDEGKDIDFTLCGDENDPIQIESMKASDWPLVPGKPLTLYVTANVVETVSNGNYEAKVLFDGLQVIDKKDTLEHLGLQLPLQPGLNKFAKQFDVPKNIPQGDVQLSAIAHDLDSKELMCATIELHV